MRDRIFLLLEDGTAVSEQYIRYISWRVRRTSEGRMLEIFAKIDENFAPVLLRLPVDEKSIEEIEELARSTIKRIAGRIRLVLDVRSFAENKEGFKPFKPLG